MIRQKKFKANLIYKSTESNTFEVVTDFGVTRIQIFESGLVSVVKEIQGKRYEVLVSAKTFGNRPIMSLWDSEMEIYNNTEEETIRKLMQELPYGVN